MSTTPPPAGLGGGVASAVAAGALGEVSTALAAAPSAAPPFRAFVKLVGADGSTIDGDYWELKLLPAGSEVSILKQTLLAARFADLGTARESSLLVYSAGTAQTHAVARIIADPLRRMRMDDLLPTSGGDFFFLVTVYSTLPRPPSRKR
jgi:hypothetical protein